MTLSAGQIQSRLMAIDADLETRQPEYEKAAEQFHHAKRNYEHALARAYVQCQGSNQKERESKALLEVVKARKEYDALVIAEASYEAHKAANRTLDTRAAIGMSLLRSMGREAYPRAA